MLFFFLSPYIEPMLFYGLPAQFIYPPAKVGGWQTDRAVRFAVPPKLVPIVYHIFKETSRKMSEVGV